MYPYSLEEIQKNKSGLWMVENLESLLVYGMYPEVFNIPLEQRSVFLQNLAGDYLYQDILQQEQLRNSRDLQKLL